jgi:phosphoribulokinase
VPRPIILGVVGDSAAGKTTITRGLLRLLGEEAVTHVCTDDYHRYDRQERKRRHITPLDPDCNFLDVLGRDIAHLRRGEAILKPVYRHADGTFGPPEYVRPHAFAIVEGLLGYHTPQLREAYDVRVYLAPPEPLRRKWKVDRDCSRRGYTTDEVLAELDRREPDSAGFIRPQERFADIVVEFMAGERGGAPEHLDARLVLRDGLAHPDLAPFIGGDGAISMEPHDGGRCVRIAADLEPDRAAEIEHAIWQSMHFASHLRSQRLGEFTVGTELHRSETLALVQVLILYHLVTARASVALGGQGLRSDVRSDGAGGAAETERLAQGAAVR